MPGMTTNQREAQQPEYLPEPQHARDNAKSVRGRFNPPNYVNLAVCACGWSTHGQNAFHKLAGHIRTGGRPLAERRAEAGL